MPHYFFHLHDDVGARDDDGTDLPDEEAARARAIKEAREVVCESIQLGYVDLRHFIEVADEQGHEVLRVSFGEAIEVRGDS